MYNMNSEKEEMGCNNMSSKLKSLSRAEQSRAEQSRAEQSRAEQSRADRDFLRFYKMHITNMSL